MLNHCNYSKVRLLHDLSRLAWYLEKHGVKDSQEAGHILCTRLYQELERDIEIYTEKLRLAIDGLSKEGKFN